MGVIIIQTFLRVRCGHQFLGPAAAKLGLIRAWIMWGGEPVNLSTRRYDLLVSSIANLNVMYAYG